MSRIWKSLLMVAPVVLSACGGGSSGGGGNGNGSTAAPAPPVNRLAAYVGTWRTACFDGWFVSHAISNGPQADTLHVTTSTHYHPRDKTCQLPAVAIQTFTPATLVS